VPASVKRGKWRLLSGKSREMAMWLQRSGNSWLINDTGSLVAASASGCTNFFLGCCNYRAPSTDLTLMRSGGRGIARTKFLLSKGRWISACDRAR
jgi:hypothetical protein